MTNNYRPPLSLHDVPKLVSELYGIRVEVVKELESYDDRNVLVKMEENSPQPPNIVAKNNNNIPMRFLCKVHNEIFSARPHILDLKNDVITHLTKAGYPTPCLIHTLEGGYQSLITLNDADTGREGKYVLKLFDFHPGITVVKICLTQSMSYQMGKLAGWMDAIWMDFPVQDHKEIVDELRVHWNLSELSQVRTKLDFVKDKSKIPLLEEVIAKFESKVLSSETSFSKGIIHSDVNDRNALAEKITDSAPCQKGKTSSCQVCLDGNYKISSIIDFGDLTYSLHIYELATVVCYLMLNKELDPLEVGATAMAGYLEHMPLPRSELIHLHTCVCARMAMSYVYGQVALADDESNAEYTQFYAARCLPMVEYLWKFSDTEFLDKLLEISGAVL